MMWQGSNGWVCPMERKEVQETLAISGEYIPEIPHEWQNPQICQKRGGSVMVAVGVGEHGDSMHREIVDSNIHTVNIQNCELQICEWQGFPVQRYLLYLCRVPRTMRSRPKTGDGSKCYGNIKNKSGGKYC